MSNLALLLSLDRLADNFRRKRICSIGLVVGATPSSSTALANSIERVFYFRFIQDGTSNKIFDTGVAIITAVYHSSKLGLEIGINSARIHL